MRTIVLQSALVLFCVGISWWVIRYTQKPLFILITVGAVVLVTIAFSILLARFTLRITRETNTHQKLFISNVAHELRTPLSIIKTSAEVELLDPELPSAARKTFQSTIGELDRISEIINNLLSLNSLTRPERMKFKRVDLRPIIDSVIRHHKELAHERGIKLRSDKNYGIHREVWGNALALEQVISGIVKNALNYTQKDSRGLVILAIDTSHDGIVQVSVTDNGIGIAQKDLPHIFEPFYRIDTSRVRHIKRGGAGLGLTLVSEIVHAHKGTIQIQSVEGRGTTVTVHLPILNAERQSPLTQLSNIVQKHYTRSV